MKLTNPAALCASALIFALSPGPAAAAEPESLLLAPAGQGEAEALPQPEAQEPQIPEGQPFAENNLGDRIAVRPLDDPANPYLGQYGEWDRWLIAQWDPDTELPEQMGMSAPWDPPKLYGMSVDSEGWLLPLIAQDPLAEELGEMSLKDMATRRWPDPEEAADAPRRYALWVYSSLPAELYEQYRIASDAEQARRLPPIPAWLGEHPPLNTVFVPNGEIVCYGELGLNYIPRGPADFVREPQGELFYRYTKDGRLLGSLKSAEWSHSGWLGFYFPERDSLAETFRIQGLRPHIVNGYTAYTGLIGNADEPLDSEESMHAEREVIAAFDYLGNEVDAALVVPNLSGCSNAHPGWLLARMYQAQLALGITSLASISPYEGSAEGPRRVDPAPRSYPQLAYRDALTGLPPSVKIQPLDSPDNPHRDSYSEWDIWLYESVGQQLPGAPDMHQIYSSPPAASAAGKNTLPAGFHVDDPADDWHMDESIYSSAGHLLPLTEVAWWTLSPRRYICRSTRSFVDSNWYATSGAGQMDSEQRMAFNNYRWQCAASRVPQIPDWLASQPVMRAVLLANGEVLTMGPLGSWTDSDEGGDELARDSFEALWFRYSPDGELLGRGYRGGNWAQFYSSALPELEARAEAASHRVHCIGEYIFIRGTRDDPTLQVYNWAGEEVEFSPALFGEMLYGEELSWCTLRNVVKVRAGEAVTIEP